ncbi:hypothetical protein D3C72_979200 [compost metagenome]
MGGVTAAEAILVGRDVAGAVLAAELPGDFPAADDRGQLKAGLEGQLVLLGRAGAEGVLAEAVLPGIHVFAGREDRIGRLIVVAGEVVGDGRLEARTEQQFVAVRIGLLAVRPRQAGVPHGAVVERALGAGRQGQDFVLLGAVTQLALDRHLVESRLAVRRAGLKVTFVIGQQQLVAILVILELGERAADPGPQGVRRAELQRAVDRLARALGLVVLEQAFLESEHLAAFGGLHLGPAGLDVVRAAIGLGVGVGQQAAEGLVRAEDVRRRDARADVLAAIVVVTAAGIAADGQTTLIEGRAGLDVHRAGDGIGVLARQQGLGDFDVGDDVAGQGVQVDGARARIDRRDGHAVH